MTLYRHPELATTAVAGKLVATRFRFSCVRNLISDASADE